MRGFIFACTNKSEKECLENLIFATNKAYGHRIYGINRGDYIFLYNLDNDVLYGTFEALESIYNKETDLFEGKYPYMVKVKPKEKITKLENASKIFKLLGINWRDILTEYGAVLLSKVLKGDMKSLRKMKKDKIVDRFYRPPLFPTTLWDFPKQSYGDTPKGNNKYPGVTPAFIIYNLIHRYTEPGDIVLDPMAGSGTTIDVCKEENRKVIALDIVPTRKDIIQADARNMPIKTESIDFIFIDSPYSDNIRYNDHPNNIGHIPATEDRFFDELEKVMREAYRVLKPGKYLAWLIGDQWAKGIFVPVGFKVYERLAKYFKPIDIVVVARRNQASNTPFWLSKALEHNFFLRGFKYLLIFQRDKEYVKNEKSINIRWNYYEREKRSSGKGQKVY